MQTDQSLENVMQEYDYEVLVLGGYDYWILAKPRLGARNSELTKKFAQFAGFEDAEARAEFTCNALNNHAASVRQEMEGYT